MIEEALCPECGAPCEFHAELHPDRSPGYVYKTSDAAPVAWRIRWKSPHIWAYVSSKPTHGELNLWYGTQDVEIQPLYAHPEDAPGGPFEMRRSCKNITGADWCVEATDDTPGVFYGPKGLCEYVRDALNSLERDETKEK